MQVLFCLACTDCRNKTFTNKQHLYRGRFRLPLVAIYIKYYLKSAHIVFAKAVLQNELPHEKV